MKHLLHSFIAHNPHAFHMLLSNPRIFKYEPRGFIEHLLDNAVGRLYFSSLRSIEITRKNVAVSALLIFGITAFVMSGIFLSPKTLNFSFTGTNCYFNPVLLPNTAEVVNSNTIAYTQTPALSLGDYPIFSTKSCIELNQIPEQSIEKITVKSPLFLSKSISMELGALPKLHKTIDDSEPVSPKDSLSFTIDQVDDTFDYTLFIDSDNTSCTKSSTQALCSLAELNLTQGSTYEYEIFRNLGDDSRNVLSGSITLLDPVKIVESSIEADQIVYENISTIELGSDKTLLDVGDVVLMQGETKIDFTLTFKDKRVIITTSSPLARASEFTLTIGRLTATDGAFLPDPYTLRFKTSSGPKVLSASVGSYDVWTGTSVAISFDVELADDASNADKAKITIGNEVIDSTKSISGNTLTINPKANLPSCTAFTVSVDDNIRSAFDISGNSSWSYNSRTRCRTTFSIGSSVQGRSIMANRFGTGPETVLFIGGLHGNEKSSVLTMNAWVDELERKYGEIPSNRTVIVIPNASPDSYVASSRTNANNVDLNRNFPSNDWATNVYQPGNVLLEGGGGSQPFSEPESAALASYIDSTNSVLVLTYHATGGAVFANGSGNSVALTGEYAGNSGFGQYSSSNEDSFFSYATTGELETWLHDKRGIPTLLVELRTVSTNEIYSQRSAMWAMVR